jgi:hypothetical protein
MKKGRLIIAWVVSLLAVTSLATTLLGMPVPKTINYQGYLTDAAGTPVTTAVNLTFSLYAASAGGAALWSEAHNGVVPVNGLYAVQLGAVKALNLSFDQQYWLGVRVGGDPELTPRQPLNSVPYSRGIYLPFAATAFSNLSSAFKVSNTGTKPAIEGAGGSGYGVRGSSTSSYGVLGTSSSSYGIYGNSSSSVGVTGYSTSNTGVWGESSGYRGVDGLSTTGIGVIGRSTSGYGVNGTSSSNVGVLGTSSSDTGVWGISNSATAGVGVDGLANSSGAIGVKGRSNSGTGVLGWTSTGRAGWFQGKVQVDGNLHATRVYITSDGRFKKNIEPLEDALEKTSLLQGVSYDWRTEEYPERRFDNRRQLGLIAQEVEKVVPEVVATSPEDGTKSVEYQNLVPLLIEAVKELKARNEELSRRLEALEQVCR